MYNIPYFKEDDKETLLQFLNDYPFAFLTGSTKEGKQVATQIPILVDERDGQLFLQGHIMKNTDHHKTFIENPQVLAVFTGPHCYVSASWYSNPQIGSTWNYMSIQLSGKMRFLSKEGLIAFMKKLTLKFEKNNAASPTFYDNLPDEFLSKMLPAIDAFEIKVDDIQNVFKLSQNRDFESYTNIISQLEKQGGNASEIAAEMKRRMGKMFPEEN